MVVLDTDNTWFVAFLVAAALAIVLAILLYTKWGKSKTDGYAAVAHQQQPAIQQGPAQAASAGAASQSAPTVVLFWASWCGHSKNMKPHWDAVKERLQGTGINMVEVDDSDKELLKANDVAGFPMLRLYASGFTSGSKDYIQYSGDRSAESIMKFITSGGKDS